MLHDNKFLKYLVYAIGEIILVVIGILIALQVNNWNEERRLNLEREKLNLLMYEDIQSLLYSLEGHITEIHHKIEVGNNFMSAIRDGQSGKLIDSMKIWAQIAMKNEDFEPQMTTYNQALASGKIGLIKNSKVLDSYTILLQYYEKFKRQQNNMAEMFYSGPVWDVVKDIGGITGILGYEQESIINYKSAQLEEEYINNITRPEVFALFQQFMVIHINMLKSFDQMKIEAESIKTHLLTITDILE